MSKLYILRGKLFRAFGDTFLRGFSGSRAVIHVPEIFKFADMLLRVFVWHTIWHTGTPKSVIFRFAILWKYLLNNGLYF